MPASVVRTPSPVMLRQMGYSCSMSAQASSARAVQSACDFSCSNSIARLSCRETASERFRIEIRILRVARDDRYRLADRPLDAERRIVPARAERELGREEI